MSRLNDPASVAAGKNCAICWRSFGPSTIYAQTLDGLTRRLCTGCYTKLFPMLPPGIPDDSQIVHLDAKAMVTEAQKQAGRGDAP